MTPNEWDRDRALHLLDQAWPRWVASGGWDGYLIREARKLVDEGRVERRWPHPLQLGFEYRIVLSEEEQVLRALAGRKS